MVRETSQSETGAWPVSFSTSDGTSDSFQRVGSFEQFGLIQPVLWVMTSSLATWREIIPYNLIFLFKTLHGHFLFNVHLLIREFIVILFIIIIS